MSARCLIITGGEFSGAVEMPPWDFVIACDHGYDHATAMGVRPDLIVGDFDSYSGSLPEDIPVIRERAEKDDTDTMLAVRHALSLGYDDIVLCCALGGRFDHAYANLQAAAFIVKNGASACLFGRDTVIYAFSNRTVSIPERTGCSLSLFSFSDRCRNVSVRGTKYRLENAELTNLFPIGVSNEWAEDEAVISVGDGVLLAVISKL